MKKIDFTENWTYSHLDRGEEIPVTIPHDAMFAEPRSETSRGGHNVGWFEGCDYEYNKTFFVPGEWQGGTVLFEFEGVYHNAEVFVNGTKAAYRPYGYTNFFVKTEGLLRYGEENRIRVIARNADQPNSRWYSGAGIYRPVWLYTADTNYIPPAGVKIRTLKTVPPTVEIQIETVGSGSLEVSVTQEGKELAARTVAAGDTGRAVLRLELPGAKLWSPEHPHLCEVRVRFEEDEVAEQFGIRTLTWNRKQGMAINGRRIILRGACIHHDNGLLGACAFPEAEERKVRLMKENGYNAIRSAHNPCSKALLDACDRLGMLVMDEYLDVWYIHKTRYDYAGYMQDWWRKDLKAMVEKDYNHPSVVLYSTGNEVSETAQAKGIALTRKMTEYLHKLDGSRPVTCGVNIFFNFLSSMGFGVYSDEKAEKEAAEAEERGEKKKKKKKKKKVGSEFYNTLAGLLGDRAMKIGATLYPCDLKTRDAFANMDIAGYNYGILRYRHDLKKYPHRLILGTETFCKDAYRFWEYAKKNPGIIGDFVWAGMDYMGEAGIGAWEYEDYAPKDGPEWGWLTAGSGRINILGRPNAEAAYTKVAFEQQAGPVIAVKPVHMLGRHTPSAWKMTDAVLSWSFPECNGKKARVEVYARAAEVELYINGRSVGRKKLNHTCLALFDTIYEEGTVTAVARDRTGREIGRTELESAGKETVLNVSPEEKTAKAGKILYVLFHYTDRKGIGKPTKTGRIHVSVKGGTLLGLGNACSYNPEGYGKDTVSVYYGEAMAAVRAGSGPDLIIEVFDGRLSQTVRIPVAEDGAAGRAQERQ